MLRQPPAVAPGGITAGTVHRMRSDQAVAVLCGGVGAARFLAGLIDVCEPSSVTAIVNTGDDVELHGLHISPDLDTITYTLAGEIDAERGWGLSGETWRAVDALERFAAVRPPGSAAAPTWFRLGDRDLATHLYRTARMREGAALSEVTAEIAEAFGLRLRLLPVTDDPLETRVTVADEGEVGFQEYFVQRRHAVAVTSVRIAGADDARPAPGVVEALETADVVVLAPSNPIVSIGPVLAVAPVRELLQRRRASVVAVSPIVAGAALKGPADRMLTELGGEASVVGVARLYADVAGTLVVDTADAALAADVEAVGVRCVVTDTIMHAPAVRRALAETVMEVVG
jgi:LPPG:FO 2-phospho-L-lactate transferase